MNNKSISKLDLKRAIIFDVVNIPQHMLSFVHFIIGFVCINDNENPYGMGY